MYMGGTVSTLVSRSRTFEVLETRHCLRIVQFLNVRTLTCTCRDMAYMYMSRFTCDSRFTSMLSVSAPNLTPSQEVPTLIDSGSDPRALKKCSVPTNKLVEVSSSSVRTVVYTTSRYDLAGGTNTPKPTPSRLGDSVIAGANSLLLEPTAARYYRL